MLNRTPSTPPCSTPFKPCCIPRCTRALLLLRSPLQQQITASTGTHVADVDVP